VLLTTSAGFAPTADADIGFSSAFVVETLDGIATALKDVPAVAHHLVDVQDALLHQLGDDAFAEAAYAGAELLPHRSVVEITESPQPAASFLRTFPVRQALVVFLVAVVTTESRRRSISVKGKPIVP